MLRIRERDASAFEAVYDAYHRLVYGIALRMLGDQNAAEDVTQTVFMKVWNAPESFVSGNLGAWLSRVTRNRSLDILRSRAVRSESEMPCDIPVEGGIDDAVFARLDGERVRALLATLPNTEREPIELGFFGGITHEEIARRTGTPLGTVKTRIRAGLRRLRASLSPEAVS